MPQEPSQQTVARLAAAIGALAILASAVLVLHPSSASAQQAPGTPTGLTVTTVSGNNQQLSASWSAPSGTVTSYDVGYTRSNAGLQDTGNDPPEHGWVWYRHNLRFSATLGRQLIHTDTSIKIIGLRPGTSYRVRVRARNSNGASSWVGALGTTPGTAPTFRAPPGDTRGLDGTGSSLGAVRISNAETPEQAEHADLIADVKQWRDDPCCAHNQAHTTRWNRVLLALGESVADTSLQAMTASEAQGFADRGWTRWVRVAETLRSQDQQQSGQGQPAQGQPTQQSTLSGAAARYDSDNNGEIDYSEYVQAINDYQAQKITTQDLLAVRAAYRNR